jgi:polysaccharide chain length determinant protein (PEP-CTERM system associated)
MSPEIERVIDEIRGAWRFRWVAFAVAVVVAVVGWLVVFALPDRYQAEARVFVDTRTALRPALQGLTVEQNVDSEINYVRQSLLAGPQLEEIAQASGVLPSTERDERRRAKILTRLSDNISLTVTTAGTQGDERSVAGTLYDIQYTESDRARCLRVVTKLLDTFVERTLGGKRQGSEDAQKFLAAQMKDYEQRLSAAENKLADFKKTNIGLMPNEQGGFFSQMQTEVDAEKKAETDLAIAVSRRDALIKELHGDAAVSAAGGAATSIGTKGEGAGSDTVSRIQEAQARLDELLLKYTEKHPDVIAAQATLDELKKRRAEELDSLRRGDANAVATSGAGASPVYQSIQLELNKQDVEIAALQRQLSQHQNTVAELRQRLNIAPAIEAEYQQLNRDYDVNKAEYTALLENYQKAQIGEKADNAGSVRFEVVLPPTAQPGPIWPKRSLFLAGVWLAAIAAGGAVAFVLHMLRPVVASPSTLRAMTDFPLLGVVGTAFPSQQQRERRQIVWSFSVASAALFAALIVALALNFVGVRIDLHLLQTLVHA